MVTTTMCISGAVLAKAGTNVNSTITNGTLSIGSDYSVDVWITEAESQINAFTRVNYTDTYSGLNDDKKKILQDVASNLAAIYAIQYDMSGYTSRIEAEDMISVLRDAAIRGLQLLRDKKVQDFIDDS